MSNRLTFKREPCETGLAGVGNPYPDVTVKHNKQKIGIINAPNWQTKDHKWWIQIAVEKKDFVKTPESPCPWKWITVKARFDSEEDARQYVTDNTERILALGVHHFED
jgi:hypothetical protein